MMSSVYSDKVSEEEVQKIKEISGKEVTREGQDKKCTIMGAKMSGHLDIAADGRSVDKVHISDFEESEWEVTGEEGPRQVPAVYSCKVCGKNLKQGREFYCEDHTPPEKCDECGNPEIRVDRESGEEPQWECSNCGENYEIVSVLSTED